MCNEFLWCECFSGLGGCGTKINRDTKVTLFENVGLIKREGAKENEIQLEVKSDFEIFFDNCTSLMLSKLYCRPVTSSPSTTIGATTSTNKTADETK